jgi:hypothetical protein
MQKLNNSGKSVKIEVVMFDESSFIPSEPADQGAESLDQSTESLPGESGRAEKGVQGMPKNAQGQVVHDVSGKKVTTQAMKKARKSLNSAAIKKIMELVSKGKYGEASTIAQKFLGLKLEQVVNIGLDKGIISEETIIDDPSTPEDESKSSGYGGAQADLSANLDKVYFALLKKYDPNLTTDETLKTKYIKLLEYAKDAYISQDLQKLVDIARNPDSYYT